MIKFLKTQVVIKIALVACCLALVGKRSDALLLGNLIGCNSFGCRLSALESDVSQLKQQVLRLSDPNMSHLNNFHPMYPNGQMNPNQSSNLNQGGQLNQGQLNPNQNQLNPNQGQLNNNNLQQQQPGNQNNANRVNYANNLDSEYQQQQQLVRRNNQYQNGLNNQFYRV